jgi:hypothetical protein
MANPLWAPLGVKPSDRLGQCHKGRARFIGHRERVEREYPPVEIDVRGFTEILFLADLIGVFQPTMLDALPQRSEVGHQTSIETSSPMSINIIMLVKELLEAQNWERFKGSSSSRVWYNANTGQAVTTNDDGNHSIGVFRNRELFGITDEDLAAVGISPDENILDYDGRLLFLAMQKGWVRIYVDGRAPDQSSNGEAVNMRALHRAFIWYCEKVGTPKRFVLVIRTGPGDQEGTPHLLADFDQIEWFIRRGTLPRERVPQQTQPAQVSPVNTTPHGFRKV